MFKKKIQIFHVRIDNNWPADFAEKKYAEIEDEYNKKFKDQNIKFIVTNANISIEKLPLGK